MVEKFKVVWLNISTFFAHLNFCPKNDENGKMAKINSTTKNNFLRKNPYFFRKWDFFVTILSCFFVVVFMLVKLVKRVKLIFLLSYFAFSAQCLKITQNVAFQFFNFGIFNELLSTQNVNVARFARNVEWDFFCDFQTLWSSMVRQDNQYLGRFSMWVGKISGFMIGWSQLSWSMKKFRHFPFPSSQQ